MKYKNKRKSPCQQTITWSFISNYFFKSIQKQKLISYSHFLFFSKTFDIQYVHFWANITFSHPFFCYSHFTPKTVLFDSFSNFKLPYCIQGVLPVILICHLILFSWNSIIFFPFNVFFLHTPFLLNFRVITIFFLLQHILWVP